MIWAPDTLHVIATYRWDAMRDQHLRWREVVVPKTCPMGTDAEPGARCVRRGGPWISVSMHAELIWKACRELLLSRLGCHPYEGGNLPTPGPLGPWAPGPLGHWAPGPLGHWATG